MTGSGSRSKEHDAATAASASTLDDMVSVQPAAGPPAPGLLLFLANQEPRYEPYRAGRHAVVAGRAPDAGIALADSLASREHARIEFRGEAFTITDLESRNGTFVNGRRIEGECRVTPPAIVRVGGSLMLLCADVRALALETVSVQRGVVLGPALRTALRAASSAAAYGRTLLVTGESGTGKELLARAFHEHGPHATGPFVAANCSAIPESVAERVLFGSRRGAFSGATDAQGLAQQAHGGTLFLDEIAELPPAVQAKLLRLLESGEVQRLGAERPERVDVNVCAATFRDLRAAAGSGAFREDLFFRIGRPEVRLPPLRDRLYEIPWHVADELGRLGGGIAASAAFIEACALRHWPGNVRELRAEARRAAAQAAAAGRVSLGAEDLEDLAGQAIVASGVPSSDASVAPSDAIAEALRAEGGNVTAASRRLGVHRNKIRRWLERHALSPGHFRRRG